MQLESEPIKVTQMIRSTFEAEGMRGFYKGCLSPLIGALPYNSL